MRILFLSLMLLGLCQSIFGQQPLVYEKFEMLEKRIKNGGDTIYMVNFWATWCKPCVDELPLFESFGTRQHAKPVKVLLVSLDFKSHIDRRVVPFIAENKLRNEVVVLTDTDTNTWMGAIDQKWDGAIPATLVVNADKRYFVQKQFKTTQDLEGLIQRVK